MNQGGSNDEINTEDHSVDFRAIQERSGGNRHKRESEDFLG